jgi:predicted enzyme related to lactoylglutathione lyase
MKNPFTWVEIYVDDLARAQQFYETILNIKMIPMETPGGFGDLQMVSFPWAEGQANISGALCKTGSMKPGAGGSLLYFACDDCGIELSRVEAAGGKIIQAKYPIGPHGFCAIAEDPEGNVIGFHSVS